MSTIDWYGNVSLVVFFAGCNLRCLYCQNSGLIPLGSGRTVPLSVLRDRLEAEKMILDAVVFTGGEPLLQPDALLEAAKLVKSYGFKVMLDTNGSIKPDVERMLTSGLFDRIALDVKAPLKQGPMGKVTGRPELGASIAESVEYCLELSKELGLEMEVRTTIAPGVSDDPEFIREIAVAILGRSHAYYLQQFDNVGEVLDKNLKLEHPPSREEMISLANIALSTGLRNVYIKTRQNGLEKVG